jgi:hypothetical protein
MTGRERMEAAFSPRGSVETPAVLSCYEDSFQTDHWDDLTSCPWWYEADPDLESQMRWRREAIPKTGEDWFRLPFCPSRETRERERVLERSGKVFWTDRLTGEEQELRRPPPGGWPQRGYAAPPSPPDTPEAVDRAIPIPDENDLTWVRTEGRDALARQLLAEFGETLLPNHRSQSPLLFCADLWGFEGMMLNIATRSDLVWHACERYLVHVQRRVRRAALLGAEAIWVVDGLSDMISARDFETLSLPHLQIVMEDIRQAGLRSVFYFTGDPAGKLDLILSLGADALAFEDPKKGFAVDVVALARRVKGGCTLFGNLDAVGVLQNGTEEHLRAEVKRQLGAAALNAGRFVMSIGSPVTPGTSVQRCQLFCDLVHELGHG